MLLLEVLFCFILKRSRRWWYKSSVENFPGFWVSWWWFFKKTYGPFLWMGSGPIVERACVRFFRKRAKKNLKREKKGKIFENFWQKCTKFENISKKGRWLRAIIARNKLLEKALGVQLSQVERSARDETSYKSSLVCKNYFKWFFYSLKMTEILL